jgi:AbrB family looped-hinge helix DNA binding protein
MPSRHVRIAPGGRVVIPAEYRKALGVGIGDHMVIELKGDELRLRSRQAAIKKVQAMLRKHIPDESRSLADELIAERREEAAREERQ